MSKKYINSKAITRIAIIAAIYAVLTVAISPISYAVMQVRLSEALTILPVFTPLAIPGLVIGCFISNLLGPAGIIDAVVGSVATLIAACGTYALRKHRFLAMCCPVVANGVIVGSMLHYVVGVDVALWACILWVSLGEAISCFVVGLTLGKLLDRHKYIFD